MISADHGTGMMPSDGQLSQSVCARRALLKLRFLLIMPAAGAGKIYSGFIFAVVDTVFFTASLIESNWSACWRSYRFIFAEFLTQ